LAWSIEVSTRAEKQLSKLDKPIARRIAHFLRERVAALEDPRSVGEALRGSQLGDYWKYRVGDYRIVADIQDSKLCIVAVHIGNRKDVYDDF
jgi:mRNA interferase RelE/StbE